MDNTIEFVTIRQADGAYPRHSEPSMIELQDGSILIVWQEFKQNAEDNAPAHLATMISRDYGMSWCDRRVVVENDPGDINVYSPSLIRAHSGDILLIFLRKHVCMTGKPMETSGFVRRSVDGGRTFGDESVIWSHQPYVFASGVVKRLRSGRLLAPVGRMTGLLWTPTDHSDAGCMWSDDDGQSWHGGDQRLDLPMRGAMEPHVAELSDGRVMMVMRTQLGAIFQSFSTDGGATWSKPQTSGIRAPESCPELVNIPASGDLLLVWNNSEYDMKFASHYGQRNPLTVAISTDDGRNWGRVKDLVDNPRNGHTNPVAFITSQGRCVVAWFEAEYSQRWLMEEMFSLRAAVFEKQWLYQN